MKALVSEVERLGQNHWYVDVHTSQYSYSCFKSCVDLVPVQNRG